MLVIFSQTSSIFGSRFRKTRLIRLFAVPALENKMPMRKEMKRLKNLEKKQKPRPYWRKASRSYRRLRPRADMEDVQPGGRVLKRIMKKKWSHQILLFFRFVSFMHCVFWLQDGWTPMLIIHRRINNSQILETSRIRHSAVVRSFVSAFLLAPGWTFRRFSDRFQNSRLQTSRRLASSLRNPQSIR